MMKKLIPFLLLPLFSSCVGPGSAALLSEASEKVVLIDYSRYVDQGYFLTEATTVSFDYIPLGSISVELKSGGRENYKASSENVEVVQYSVYDALDLFCDKLKEIGADGVLKLGIKDSRSFLWTETVKVDVYGNNYVVTGMAFKRKSD